MIAIKGIDMPANCDECPLIYPVGFYRNLPFSIDKSKGCCILVREIEDPNIKIDGEDGCDVCNKSASISQIKMLECILNFIISTGKDNGVDDITARVYLRQTLDNIIDYVYRLG